MQTLGERLEEARKRKGISIREAAEATKIRGDYLQKFEANTFEIDLPPLYIRGFVRAYARFLDFDAPRFLAEYDALVSGDRRPAKREPRENYGRVEFGSDNADSNESSRPSGLDPVMLKNLLLGGGVVIAIIIIVLIINAVTSSSSARTTSTEAASDTTSAPAKSSTAAPATAAQTLTFTALDTTRIKIVRDADKGVVYDGTFARGETRSFRKTGVLLVTVEDRAKLRMEVNGRAMEIPVFETGNYGRFKLD